MFWTLHKWNYFGSALPWKLGDTSIYLKITVDYLAAAALDSSARRRWYGGVLIMHNWHARGGKKQNNVKGVFFTAKMGAKKLF